MSERSEYMKIEKLNNDKLKVILNKNDLEENNIDLNTFMANSLESQELFLDILDLAEEKFDFYANNSKLLVESISLANNIFIFTITKLYNESTSISSNYIYCFSNFDNFSSIITLINNDTSLYEYNSKFYLIINMDNRINNILNEFSVSRTISSCLENILTEHGKKIFYNR